MNADLCNVTYTICVKKLRFKYESQAESHKDRHNGSVHFFLTELFGKWATLCNSVCLYGSGWACCCKKQPSSLKMRSHYNTL